MKNLYNNKEAEKLNNDPLGLRVYTSRLLGQDSNLVLHGGGNTSVKTQVENLFGEKEDVLYVKGSGWDLATIEAAGFAPVRMETLFKMAELEQLTDTEMVRWQRAAMIDPYAPNPSVEAILHAIIPFAFVDHTHADAVVTITNTPDGEKRIQELYGKRVIVIPYIMPGFVLARKVYEMTRDINWSDYDGMILLNHGVFTFDDDAQKSYERMIQLVSEAEDYLAKNKAIIEDSKTQAKENLKALAKIRREISNLRGRPVVVSANTTSKAVDFSNLSNLKECATQGPLTPDHVIRTKRIPVILSDDFENDLQNYSKDYQKYFEQHQVDGLTCLDSAPRWSACPGYGTLSFGASLKEANIISDIIEHTCDAIQKSEKLGGWKALPSQDIFDVEYWELEQAKLAKQGAPKMFQGKIALVTGAASGIGKAAVQALTNSGAVVAALDINPEIENIFSQKEILPIVCDLTKSDEIKNAVEETIRNFGGLDIVVSNAGIFPESKTIEQLENGLWQKSLDVNLSSHQTLIREAIPYLSSGIDPAIVVVASKNVPAPGKGAAAYSVAKAGLTQLARVAALELASKGIRVNVLHPNAVFDTAIWTDDVLAKRAQSYNMTVDEYKKSNLLQVEIQSKDVAELICQMAGPAFSKTTGSQVPIDGGSDRII